MAAAPIDPRTFRSVLGQFCTGITIITTVHDDVPIGFACQSFAALSLDPPLVLFCPDQGVAVLEGHRGQRAVLRQRADRAAEGRLGAIRVQGTRQVRRNRLAPFATRFADHRRLTGVHRLHGGVRARRRRPLRGVRRGRIRCPKCPRSSRGRCCSIAATTPASSPTRPRRPSGATTWKRS